VECNTPLHTSSRKRVKPVIVCPGCFELIDVDIENEILPHPVPKTRKTCEMSGKFYYEWDEYTTRKAVAGRSCGICECCGRAKATDMHHRISRGVGGQWTPANILHLCRSCHGYITDHPNMAYRRGLSLRHGDNPESIPLQRLNGITSFISDQVVPPNKRRSAAGTRPAQKKGLSWKTGYRDAR